VSYPKTQIREHGSVSSLGAKGVDVGRGGTLNNAEVSAYNRALTFVKDSMKYSMASLNWTHLRLNLLKLHHDICAKRAAQYIFLSQELRDTRRLSYSSWI